MKTCKKWLVYKVTSPSGKMYVGQTSKTLEQRRADHEKEAFKPKYKDNAFKRAIRKYGDELEWSVIEDDITSLAKSHERETHWIQELGSADSDRGYNSTMGGAGVLPTDEVKQKISASVSKANLERFSDEKQLARQRDIIRDAHHHPDRVRNLRRARSSVESRRKTSVDLRERYSDPETRNNMAVAQGGRKFKVYRDGEFVGEWVNQAQCARDLGLPGKCHISNCLHGRRKTYLGYSFEVSE